MMDYYKKALKYIYKIKKELNINKKLKHKNILNYQNYEIINKELFIYMEYMSLGSLAQQIEANGPLDEEKIKSYSK